MSKQIKLLAVNIQIGSTIYRLASVVVGKDGSYYWISHMNDWLKKKQIASLIPIKYSYHPSGNNFRMTGGPDTTRFFEFKGERRTPIGKITQPESLSFMSLFRVNDNIEQFLDKKKEGQDYLKEIVLQAWEYEHLTLRFFLANKLFKLDCSTREYKEVYTIEGDGVNAIVTTEDVWLKP